MRSRLLYSYSPRYSDIPGRVRLSGWQSAESDHQVWPHLPQDNLSLRPPERISWEHAVMDLRNYPCHSKKTQYLRREQAWNSTFSVSSSKANSELPKNVRSYFGRPRELDSDGVMMSPMSSRVWRCKSGKSQKRNDLSNWIHPYKSEMPRPPTPAPRSGRVSQNTKRPATVKALLI